MPVAPTSPPVTLKNVFRCNQMLPGGQNHPHWRATTLGNSSNSFHHFFLHVLWSYPVVFKLQNNDLIGLQDVDFDTTGYFVASDSFCFISWSLWELLIHVHSVISVWGSEKIMSVTHILDAYDSWLPYQSSYSWRISWWLLFLPMCCLTVFFKPSNQFQLLVESRPYIIIVLFS